ncbi:1429_t:CDS:2, partial [Acaulospora colombiana]
APNESLKRQFRASQKHVERDMGNLKTMAKEMSQKEGQTTEDAISALDSMIAKVDSLQSKLAEVHEKGTTPIVATMRTRLRHLDELDKLDENELDPWTDTRINRWLVDWNLRNGHMETARLLADENGIEDLVDLSLFAEIQRIEQALEKHSCTEALAWCSDNKNALRKIK